MAGAPAQNIPPPPDPSQIAATMGMSQNPLPMTPDPSQGIQLPGTSGNTDLDLATSKAALDTATQATSQVANTKMNVQRVQAIQSQTDKLLDQLPQAEMDKAKGEADAAAAEAASIQRNKDQFSEMRKALMAKETPPDDPPPEYKAQSPLERFGSMSSMLGVFASLFTKKPLENALNASAGAMKAMNEGNEADYNRAYQKWQDKAKLAMEHAKEDRERLKDIIDLQDRDVSLSIAQAKALAAERGWPAVALNAQAGDLEGLSKLYESTGKAVNGYKDSMDFLKEQHEALEVRKLEADAANGFKGRGGNLNSDAIAEQVGRYIGGDKTAISSAGYSPQDREAILNGIAAARKNGITPEIQAGIDQVKQETRFAGETSYQRSLGTQGANIATAAESVGGAATMLKDASAALDRTQYPNINAIELAIKQGTGDPALATFDIALDSLATERARALNPRGVPREGDIESARRVLSRNMGDVPLDAAIDQIIKETDNIKASVARTRGMKDEAGKTVLPAEAVKQLQEGVHTTFKNGQTWTLQNGQPVQVQ